jgi:cyclase
MTQGTVRIIPRLDVKGPNVVKGIHLEGLRIVGKPAEMAARYYAEGADEILFMDIVASLYERNNLLDIVEWTSRHVFIPMTVGGGLRNLSDIQNVLRAGADKVALNTAAHRRPELIKEAAQRFGSSTIVLSIEVIRQSSGKFECFVDNGRQAAGREAVSWAEQAASLGAGEILVTSVDKEGTGKGFEVELTRQIAERVSIPVIASGGAGTLEHIADIIRNGQANAVCIASMLHYHPANRLALDNTGDRNTVFQRNEQSFSKVQLTTLPEIKSFLQVQKIETRPMEAFHGYV